ncbi:MAG: hypothetical protein V3V25_07455 [Paracoccaceae bacterium]
MRRILMIALLPLVGCASPQEQCIANAGNDIRVVSKLIATTRANINRGYGIRTEEFFENERQVCGIIDDKEVFCDVAVADSRQVPVALDLNTEKSKLDSLLEKHAQLSQRANAVVAECQIRYPQT